MEEPDKKTGRGHKKDIDLERLEADYRSGAFSDRELGSKYGISHTLVQRYAKRYEWQKDMAAVVRAATEARLLEAEVSKVASKEVAKRVAEKVSAAVPVATEVVAAIAEVNSQVVLRHRDGLRRLGLLRDKLLNELESITDNIELFEQLGEVMDGSQDDGERKRVDKAALAYQKVISLSGRINDAKYLAEIDERIRKGEREAFGLDAAEDEKERAGRTLTDVERATRLARLVEMANARRSATDIEAKE